MTKSRLISREKKGLGIVFKDGCFQLEWEVIETYDEPTWFTTSTKQYTTVYRCTLDTIKEDYHELFEKHVGRPLYDILASLQEGDFVHKETISNGFGYSYMKCYHHKDLRLQFKAHYLVHDGKSYISEAWVRSDPHQWELPGEVSKALDKCLQYLDYLKKNEKIILEQKLKEEHKLAIIKLFDSIGTEI